LNKKLYGRWIKINHNRLILALNLHSFSFEWINDALSVIQTHPIEGQTLMEIEQGIADALTKLGFTKKSLDRKLNYEIPVYPFTHDPFNYLAAQDLLEWEQYRTMANRACFDLLGMLQIAGEIRIWPHHFDTGIYVEPKKHLGLGFGLAMTDNLVGNPYFYFSAHGLNDYNLDYNNMPELSFGQWIINESWKGAVLPLPLLKQDSTTRIFSFLQEVSKWYLKN